MFVPIPIIIFSKLSLKCDEVLNMGKNDIPSKTRQKNNSNTVSFPALVLNQELIFENNFFNFFTPSPHPPQSPHSSTLVKVYHGVVSVVYFLVA